MNYLDDLVVFVRVVDAKSFSAAARQMVSTKSAVSKRVTKLEQTLGTKLLNRTTRKLSLTDVGAAVYAHSAKIVEETLAIESTVAGLQATPTGILRVSTSVAFGNLHLTGLLPEFLKRHPELTVMLGLNDRYVDIAEEGFDVVIRLTSSPGQNMIARRLAPINYVACASPQYLETHEALESPADLQHHNCLTYGYLAPKSAWDFFHSGEWQSVKIKGNLVVNSSESLRAAVLQGCGIALLPTFVVGEDLRKGDLRKVLEEYSPTGSFGTELYAVYLPNRFLAPKVRAFIDYLIEKLNPIPSWDKASS